MTVTKHVAVAPQSLDLQVIVAVPGPIPVTTPFVLTVATPELVVVHVTLLLVALAGVKLTAKHLVLSTLMLVLAGETTIALALWYSLYQMVNKGRLLSTEQSAE